MFTVYIYIYIHKIAVAILERCALTFTLEPRLPEISKTLMDYFSLMQTDLSGVLNYKQDDEEEEEERCVWRS